MLVFDILFAIPYIGALEFLLLCLPLFAHFIALRRSSINRSIESTVAEVMQK